MQCYLFMLIGLSLAKVHLSLFHLSISITCQLLGFFFPAREKPLVYRLQIHFCLQHCLSANISVILAYLDLECVFFFFIILAEF